MPEKFMTFAVLGFVLCALLAAWLRDQSAEAAPAPGGARAISRKQLFYINSAQLLGLLVFLGLAYPALFFMNGFTPRISLSQPTSTTWFLLTLLAVSFAVALLRGKTHGWWSPFPLINGMLAASTLASWLGESQGLSYPLWPDWRYIGGAAVLYVAALVLIDAFLWAVREPADDGQFVSEFARLCAVLPALLVYAVGVRV